MRILELRLSAIGPYEKEIRLDFSELSDNAFLLIHGATGAGKTSIFDAICFALYGEGSMAGRSSALLRNSAASPDVDSFVELVFAVGDESYRICRIPTYQRRAKRGGGITTQNAEVSLERLTGEPFVWRKEKEVAPEIERLLGLRCDQFRQVVLLPQGEFQKFLMARTDERRELLSVIFNTGLYARLEKKLKSKTEQLKKKLENSQTKNAELLRNLGAATADELRESIEAKAQVMAAQKDALTTLKKESKAAKDAETEGRKIEALFSELLLARRESETKEAISKADEKSRARLELAQRAALLMDAAAKRDDARQEAKRSELALQELLRRGKETSVAYKRAAEIFSQEEARQPQREAEKEKLLKLKGLLESVDRLEEKRREEKLLAVKAEAARGHQEKLKKELEESIAKLEKNREAHGHAALVQAEGRSAALREEKLAAALKNKQAAEEAAAKLKAAESNCQKAEKVWREAKGKLNDAESEERVLLILERQTRAAILAVGLTDGAPCPVCGATHHPELAHADRKVTEAMLKRAERAKRECEGLEAAARAALEEAKLTLGSSRTAHAGLLQLSEGEARSMEELLLESLKERKAREAGERAASSLARLEAEEKQLMAEKSRLEEEEKLAQDAAKHLDKELTALQAELETLKRSVPKGLQGEGLLLKEVRRLERAAEAGEARYKKARSEKENLESRLAEYKGKWHTTKSQMESSQEKAKREDAAFRERLLAAGFSAEEEYQEALSGGLHDEARRRSLEEELRLHERELHAACEWLKRAQSAAEGKARPDMDALSRRVQELETRVSEREHELGRLDEELSRSKEGLLECEKRRAEEKELEHAYGVAASLSEWASGTRGEHISFQSYVLGWLLDEVLAAANIRLLRMSRDRYTLVRGERSRKNAQGGLDLAVMDSYTGEARPMATLSGGESFLASLSLALGLSDIVQQEAGGVHLDTMFIDEGFGTLDTETLDNAVEVLMELAGEGRLVGIISHVEELKRRIPARLEVRKLPSGGSTARFVFGTEED